MKKLIFSLLFLASFSVILSSCKKDEEETDTNAPLITVSSPSESAMFMNGDTVFIKANVTDASLHELLVKIQNTGTSEVVFTATPVVHDLTEYNLDTYWVSNVSDHSNMLLSIEAIDHNDNSSSKTVHFHVMP